MSRGCRIRIGVASAKPWSSRTRNSRGRSRLMLPRRASAASSSSRHKLRRRRAIRQSRAVLRGSAISRLRMRFACFSLANSGGCSPFSRSQTHRSHSEGMMVLGPSRFRPAGRWVRATGYLAGAGLLLALSTMPAGAQQQPPPQQQPQVPPPQQRSPPRCFTVEMSRNSQGNPQGSILLDRCTGKTWLLLCVRNDSAGCAFQWAPIPDATEPAAAGRTSPPTASPPASPPAAGEQQWR